MRSSSLVRSAIVNGLVIAIHVSRCGYWPEHIVCFNLDHYSPPLVLLPLYPLFFYHPPAILHFTLYIRHIQQKKHRGMANVQTYECHTPVFLYSSCIQSRFFKSKIFFTISTMCVTMHWISSMRLVSGQSRAKGVGGRRCYTPTNRYRYLFRPILSHRTLRVAAACDRKKRKER